MCLNGNTIFWSSHNLVKPTCNTTHFCAQEVTDIAHAEKLNELGSNVMHPRIFLQSFFILATLVLTGHDQVWTSLTTLTVNISEYRVFKKGP